MIDLIQQQMQPVMRDPLEFRRRGGFSPASLFAGGESGAWYDVSDMASLWQDTSGTVPVTAVGQPVGRISDKSGNGHDLLLTGIQGTLQLDPQGNMRVFVPQGGTCRTAFNITMSPEFYMAVASNRTADANNWSFGLFNSTDSAYAGFIQQYSNSSILTNASNTNSSVLYSEPGVSPLNSPNVIEARFAPGVAALAFNASTTEQTGANTLTAGNTFTNCAISICGTGSSGSAKDSHFYGAIVREGVMGADRIKAGTYLAGICGVSSLWGRAYDLFGVGGQSNAVGINGETSPQLFINYGEGAEFCPRQSYIKTAMDSFHQGDAEVAVQGSMWPAFAQKYYELTGRRALLVGAAVGGIGVCFPPGTAWSDYAARRTMLLSRMADAKSYIDGKGGSATVRGIIFLGGERDADNSVAKATFVAAYSGLLSQFRAESGDPSMQMFSLSIDNSTDAGLDSSYANIRQGIIDSCAATDGMHLVMPFQDFDGSGMLVDSVHWNQTAQNSAGVIAATNIAALL